MTDLVTVYTKDDCQPCKATKIYMMKHGISFVEINVSKNATARDALADRGYQTVPVVEYSINGIESEWTGFRPDRIQELAYLIEDSNHRA